MSNDLSEAKIFNSGLSQIPKALSNEKALFVLLSTGLLTMALAFLGRTLGGSFAPPALNLVTLLVVLPAGTSVAGLLLMDQARGQTPRPLGKAVSDGIPAFLRIFAITLLGIVLTTVFVLLLIAVFSACKLPVIGPVLYAVLLPVLLILGGLLHFGLMAGFSITCPAVWNGATASKALGIFWQIVTNRGLELLVNLLLLAVLIILAEIVLVVLVFVGGLPVTMTSANILGAELLTVFSSPATGGHALAASFSFMVLLMLVLTALTAMGMMGLNLIYLRITSDMDKQETTIATSLQETATNDLDRNMANGPQDILASILPGTPPPATMAETARTTQICPRCKATASLGDRFCGECGGNLPG